MKTFFKIYNKNNFIVTEKSPLGFNYYHIDDIIILPEYNCKYIINSFEFNFNLGKIFVNLHPDVNDR